MKIRLAVYHRSEFWNLYEGLFLSFMVGNQLVKRIYLFSFNSNILSVNEKLPASKFQYFGKYIIQLFGYCYDHVSGQSQTGLER